MRSTLNQLKKITINNHTFVLDEKYQLIMDLISPKFEGKSLIIDQLFGRENEIAQAAIDSIIKDGCLDDPAMTYFITMALQNYRKHNQAARILKQLYLLHPTDLVARCAYANYLLMSNRIDEIPTVFGNSFDLSKLWSAKVLPFVLFVDFMAIVCNYYLLKKDIPNFLNYLSYLTEAAPEHYETQKFLELLQAARS